ncbi:hypothetical protein N665_0078s0073 [Sinapis alba]|nr:hypothetical protein N665_0078s0073 [Sinapis alba]
MFRMMTDELWFTCFFTQLFVAYISIPICFLSCDCIVIIKIFQTIEIWTYWCVFLRFSCSHTVYDGRLYQDQRKTNFTIPNTNKNYL